MDAKPVSLPYRPHTVIPVHPSQKTPSKFGALTLKRRGSVVTESCPKPITNMDIKSVYSSQCKVNYDDSLYARVRTKDKG